MKLKIALLLLLLTFPFTIVTAQNQSSGAKAITYQCKSEKMANALRKVERLSGYYKIQFAIEDVSPYKVTVKVKDVKAEEAVKQILQGTKSSIRSAAASFRCTSTVQRHVVTWCRVLSQTPATNRSLEHRSV